MNEKYLKLTQETLGDVFDEKINYRFHVSATSSREHYKLSSVTSINIVKDILPKDANFSSIMYFDSINEGLKFLTKEIYAEEVKSQNEKTNIFKYLTKKKDETKTPKYIFNKLKEKIENLESFNKIELLIDHKPIKKGTPIYILDFSSFAWAIRKSKLRKGSYQIIEKTANYNIEGDPSVLKSRYLKYMKKDGAIKTDNKNIYLFFKEEDAINFYNKRLDEFNAANKRIVL